MAETEPFEVVISGIGGRFPESNSMEELKDNLFGKVDMITTNEREWLTGYDGIQRGSGKIFDIRKFDSTFFGVHRRMSQFSDPLLRILLERTFEAIIDSGNNPKSIVGTNIGVYCAFALSESENGLYHLGLEGFSIVGHNKGMISNRISYFYNLKGPSVSMSDSWVGSMEALRQAAKSIADGRISAAIVGVCNLHSIPHYSKLYEGLGLICSDGKCRSFDNEATGYPRSEGVVAFFLQRKIDAKRNYGTVVHVKTEQFGDRQCGYVRFEEEMVTKMLREFYKECKVDPSSISYLEADGSAVKRVETIELNSLSKVLCEGRQSPLLIGSVKSNLGHTEASSPLVSVVKTVIAMENGIIPPNLHYRVPNAEVAALCNGKLKVVSDAENLPGDLVAVNSMTFSGGMGHAVLRRNSKVKKEILQDGTLPEDGLPRLILASARHAEGIQKLSDSVKSMALDIEFVALMNNIHKDNITGNMYRMFHILPAVTDFNGEVQEFKGTKPEVWFIFSGMGSQWIGMGAGLMNIPVFAAAIDKCDKVLAPFGIDIKYVLTTMDKSVFENIINCFVGIAAVQIGLVDVLKSLNIAADGFVGHSVGELGCAYADGCFTAEQMILSSYFRGIASLEAGCIKGMMAAVGLGYNDIKDRLPESIQVACRNSSTSCTISGPAEDMMVFVDQLKSENTFATAVNVANIAYHSRYVAPAGPILLKYLKEIIQEPKLRSSKWICSSIPETEWNTPLAKSCSAEYFTNNLLSPVLFEESCRHIPANAVTIEIAPHGLLQAILRRSLPTINISLTSRSAICSVRYLLQAVGRMYLNNLHPDVNALYPAVEYPVSRGTPGIAGLVSWDHNEDWPARLGNFSVKADQPLYEVINIINMGHNSPDLGHRMNNQVVIPVSMLLMYVWKKFYILLNMKTDLPSVVFQDVNISKHVSVPYMDDVKMNLLVQSGSFKFEITTSEGESVMNGRISQLDTKPGYTLTKHNHGVVHVSHSDFYSLFESRGLELDTYYKSVKQLYLDERECSGEITWNNDWVPFLDSLIKVNMFLTMNKSEGVHEPSFIQRLSIDTSTFSSLAGGSTVPFRQCSRCNMIQCDGIEMLGVKLTQCASPPPSILKVEKLMFVPHIASGYEMKQLLSIVVQVVCETNMMSWQSKVTRIVICDVSDDPSETLAQQFQSIVQCQFNIEAGVKTVLIEELKPLYLKAPTTFHMIVARSTLLYDCIQQFNDNDNVYFLTYYPGKLTLTDETIVPVLQYKLPPTNFALLKKRVNVDKWNLVDNIEGSDWLLQLNSRLLQIRNDEPIILCWNYGAEVCVTQICKVLAMEQYARRLRCFFILDKNAPAFSKTNAYYMRQLHQGLAVNVMSDGVWGSFRRLEMDVSPEIFKHQVDVSAISLEGVDVKYFGLNPYNLSVNSEEVKDEEFELGHLEYSGVSKNRQEVMGLARFDKFKNIIKPDDTLSWIVPEGWSSEEAATVPLAFTTAYYSLALLTRLRAGETVLITAGYSPIGEAAIAVALYLGGEVFTTVSNDEQTAALIKRFPDLKKNKILHESNFDVSLILKLKGKKLRVIINSLEGQCLNEILGSLDNNSQFVQLSQTSMKKNEKIGMQVFLRNTVIYSVGSNSVFNATQDWKNKMKAMVQEGIKKAVVKPFQRKMFAKDQSIGALKYLKMDHLVEKVILAMKHVNPSQPGIRMQFKCDHNKSYLIVGTKYSLWLDLAKWLVVRGARKIMVAVEEISVDKFDSKKFSGLISRYNAKIKLTSATCADIKSDALNLIKETMQLGPLAAIFSIMLNNDSNKVKNLDSASRKLASESPFFVCLFGGGSEVCDARRQSGLPGLAIQWDIPLQKPVEVLNYLQPLLDNQDMSSGSQLILVNTPVSHNEQKDLDSCYKVLQEYLPTKLELYDMGASLSDKVVFEEVDTLSPKKKFVKSSMCVFLFPGINTSRLQSLVSKLIYPAFCIKLPSVCQIIQETASLLVSEMICMNRNGPYTLVSETWCGALAVEVGCQLEAQGYTVGLILLDSAPATTQSWASMMGPSGSQVFDDTFICLLLKLRTFKIHQDISKAASWANKLKCALMLEDKEKRENIGKGLTSFRSKLTAVLNYKPSGQLFQGQVHLLRLKTASRFNVCDLFQYCGENVLIHVIEDASTHAKLIASGDTATIINENTVHRW